MNVKSLNLASSISMNMLEAGTTAVKPKQLNFVETWSVDTSKFKVINEDSEFIVDGTSILGIIEGPMFVPDGDSRNGRHYTRQFWETVIAREEVQFRLRKGLMGGQIGHKITPVTDEDWNKGEVSHKVVKLWITDDNEGWGKIVIFNTPAGRNLKVYFDSKTELYTSSRASGDYVEGLKINSLPVVDESTFYLDTFDFVQNPGFLQAQPILVEELLNEKGENSMEELIKKLQESIDALAAKFPTNGTVNENNESLTKVKEALNEQFKELKKSTSFLESIDKSTLEALKELPPTDLNNMVKKIYVVGESRQVNYTHEGIAYDGVFTPTKLSNVPLDKLHNALSTGTSWNENYPSSVIIVDKKENNSMGSNGVVMLWKTGSRPKDVLEGVNEVISINGGSLFEGYGVDHNKVVAELKEYRQLGKADKIQEALVEFNQHLPVYNEYLKLGEASVIKEVLTETAALQKDLRTIGKDVPTIKRALKEGNEVIVGYRKVIDKANESKHNERAVKLSNFYGLPLESVSKILKKMGESEAKVIFKSMSKVENNPKPDNNKPKAPTAIKNIGESSRASRIFESSFTIGGRK
jgi:hypothetical protein